MNQEQAVQFAEAWADAWNRHDLERVLAHYDADVEMTSPFIAELTGDPRGTLWGKSALRAYWQEALIRFPDLRFELIGVYAGVDGLAIHYESVRGLLACEVLTLNDEGVVTKAAAHYVVPADRREASGPRVLGILETALTVAEPPRSADFYRRLFGLSTLLETERLIALGVAGRDVLLLFREGSTSEPFAVPGGIIPPHGADGSSHLAFSIAAADLGAWRARLDSEDVPVESVVTWPGGSTSLYFRDPDDHLLELITPGFWPIRSGCFSVEEETSDGRLP
jgi:catechol 2,3-dioxygenase-like lactoylglutathione lyase family enzyme/ketosteroid isomerase-like protein